MGTVRDALEIPGIRRIELGYGMSVTGEFVGVIASLVYAFNAGGAPFAGAYAAARTLGGAGVMLVLTSLTSRLRWDHLLRQITVLRAALLSAAALTAALHQPPPVVIVLAAADAALSWTYRPLQATSLPWLVRTPAELTASSAVSSVMDNFGRLAGPLLAGGLLALASPAASMALAAGFLCAAAVWLRRLAVPSQPEADSAGAGPVIRDVSSGIAEFVRLARAGVATLTFAQRFARGALFVLTVVLAVHVLALNESAVGWLNAAMGAGGLVGGGLAAAVVRVTHLGRSFVTGVLLWALALALLALAPTVGVAYLALVIAGIGNSVQYTGSSTLVTCLAGPRAAGRALAARELVLLAGLGAGSLTAPPLLQALGLRSTFALLGCVLAVLAIARAASFSRLDRATSAPGPRVGLLRSLDMFAPLPLAVTELLATKMNPCQFPPGAVILREGEAGDLFHVISSGTATVTVRGVPRPTLHAGDCFGEIALLRDIPRTATITAQQSVRTFSLGREDFLLAVTGNSVSRAAAHAFMTRRLGDDPPADIGEPVDR